MFGVSDHKAVDPSITTLGKLLQEEIAPVVMVLSTPLVEDSCIKNGLSFVQMLTPFCFFDNIDVPVRTASDQPYRLQKFNLRLLYGSSIRQPDFEVSKGYLRQVIRSAGDNILDLSSEPPDIGDLMVAPQSEILPSWFECFNKELIRIPCFSDHEAFDHPVACLLVISSKDEQPINRFVDLFNTKQLPPLLNDGMMDPKILKHYLLVHDNQNGLPDEVENILSEMKNTFGSNDCHLLCINSSEAPSEECSDNPWICYNITSVPSPHIGRYLDVDDKNTLKELMQDLSSKHIIPHMEQKIRMLNQQVSMTRKGFRNQIKNLWWRKGKEETEDSSNGSLYTFSSIESQIRVLGDYAFMLHDYELALTNYRLLSTDYKLDKSWKRYAGVQEMMGLAYFMLDASRKEAEYCMENAFNIYVKIGSSGWKNAVRCGLWWADMLKTWDQFSDAAAVFSRISGEEPLHSAVLLEQASYCYLFSKPPMFRKHGFHLVLSGDLYKRCDQINHAIRTYRCALSVYKGTTWKPLNDHVRFYIGKWYAVLGNFDVAINLMLQILECSHQSSSNQGLFLLDFIAIVERVGKEFEVPGLQLPILNMKSLKVLNEDHRTYASSAAASVSENVWKSLETEMIPSIPTSKTNWLESQENMPSTNNKELNFCVVGEPVKVAIEFRNPLQISLSISNVALICELSRTPDECASEAKSESQNKEEINHSRASSNPMSHTTLFTLSNANFFLGGGETSVAYLEVTPLAEGVLKITGIRWRLSSLVGGFHNFIKPVTETTHKRRIKSRSTVHDVLEFIVIGNLPRLAVTIHHFPKKVYVGSLHHLHMELTNESEYHVKNLKVNVSHPRVMRIATCENLNADSPECIEKGTDYEHGCGQRSFSEFSSSVFTFPEVKLMRGERPLLWPIWLRATTAGQVSLYLTLYYEMKDAFKAIRFRCLRMYYSLEVLPSLNVDFKFSRFPSKLDELLVRMDVKNDTDSQRFVIHQLLMASSHWKMSPIQPLDAVLPSCRLSPGRAFSFFFNLKSEKNTGDDSTSSQSQVGNMSFSSSEQDAPLFDLCTPPFADFHSSERFYQRVALPCQEDILAVEFVLISRLLRQKNNDTDPLPLFLSHHTCGCSLADTGPIWWVLNGPRAVSHDFSVSFCEVQLTILLHNTSDLTAAVQVTTADVRDNIKPTSNPLEKGVADPVRVKPGPWIWSGPINRKVELGPYRRVESPLQISVFAPGVYDLSEYLVEWTLAGVPDAGRVSSGVSKGLPFFLRVTQKQ